MRTLVRRGLGPVFEALVSRLDPAVDPSEHQRFVEAVLAQGLPAAAMELAGSRTVIAQHCASLEIGVPAWCTSEVEPGEKTNIALLPLLPPATTLAAASGAPIAAPAPARWEDDPETAAACSTSLFGRLCRGEVEAGEAIAQLRALADGFEPRRWFPLKRGTLYGSADLLRAVIRLCEIVGPEPPPDAEPLRAYARAVLDRTIRHLEVRRDAALELASASRAAGADVDLDRLRFSLALLDGAELFSDLRYLNSALKVQDWMLRRLQDTKPGARDRLWTLRFLHYLSALDRQEEQMRRAFSC